MPKTDWNTVAGYASRVSGRPGDTVGLHVSTSAPRYRATIVRLPGRDLVSELGTHSGEEQGVKPGSYGRIESTSLLDLRDGFRLELWLFPTRPDGGRQGIMTRLDPTTGAGYGIFLDRSGRLELSVSDGTHVSTARTESPVRGGEWYRVAATWDPSTSALEIAQEPALRWPDDPSRTSCRETVTIAPAASGAPLLLAAAFDDSGLPGLCFDGKLERPRILGGSSGALREVASWDFALEIPSTRILDRSANALHGLLVNAPTRAVTGHSWNGNEHDWRRAPEQYAAIHFHSDDLEDTGWGVAFELEVPAGWRSGLYAARLEADDAEDEVPFFVRPERGKPGAQAVFLAPTLTYLSYSNETIDTMFAPLAHSALDDWCNANRQRSHYDRHSDGSGVSFASLLRPLTQFRAGYLGRFTGSPHCLAADLLLLEWLGLSGFAVDVVTDHDLHAEGFDALAPYRVVLTGGHPEYWTETMLDALSQYLGEGGRMLYLGGNGFNGCVAIDPERPHLSELRRNETNGQIWQSSAGEHRHSTDGQPGGLLKRRGYPEHRLCGIGYTAVGNTPGRPYQRVAGSFDARASWIFEGVNERGPIGDFGAILGGAASYEIDRYDMALGSPPHALVLATATGFDDNYLADADDVAFDPVYPDPHTGRVTSEARDQRIRADMVYFETENGGAVFSVGSVGWCGSLLHEAGNNDVSRITANVLRRFLQT